MPTSLAITQSTKTSLTLEWSSPSTGGGAMAVDRYKVVLLPENTTYDAYSTSITIFQLISSTEYSFYVIPIDSDGRVGTFSETIINVTGIK